MVELPSAPVHQPLGLRGDYSRAASDYTVTQQWDTYSDADHAIWATLYRRQIDLIERYAAPEFLSGVQALGASERQIPRFEDANRVLAGASSRFPGSFPRKLFLIIWRIGASPSRSGSASPRSLTIWWNRTYSMISLAMYRC